MDIPVWWLKLDFYVEVVGIDESESAKR